jgi:hypothetical protein
MKFRRNKIKREHSIIKGALDWLEDLSKNREVTDIIPGVIDVTRSKERGITYQYETPTGCKLLLKKGGSIQEVFVVTKKPQFVQKWVTKIMEELELLEAALDDQKVFLTKSIVEDTEKSKKNKFFKPRQALKQNRKLVSKNLLSTRDNLLVGITEDYQLVEINQGLRDSFVESLASMADLEGPKIEDSLDPLIKDELENLQKKLNTKP